MGEVERSLNSSSRFRINRPNVISETIDGEVVIINLETGNYYSLDNVGVVVWSFVERSATLGEIVESLGGRYESSLANVEKSVFQLIGQFRQENLIAPDQEAGPEHVDLAGERADSGWRERRLTFEAPILRKYTDMQDLLLLDPIHQVDETGWPSRKPDQSSQKR